MSELAVLAYAEDLSDFTPDQLDAACIEARRTSEFMPVSATIRNCLSRICTSQPAYLGPPLLEYPEIAAEEREAALVFSEQLKKNLGLPAPGSLEKPSTMRAPRPIRDTPSGVDVEDRRAELGRQGELIRKKYPEPGNVAGIPPDWLSAPRRNGL